MNRGTLRSLVSVAVIGVMLLFSGACNGGGKEDKEQAEGEPQNPCSSTGPNNNSAAPIICVDDTNFPTITIDPPPNVKVKLKRNATVHWFTRSGAGSIGIVFEQNQALDQPQFAPSQGHTKAHGPQNASGEVKYSVVVQKNGVASNVIDPTIIIETE